MATRQQFDSCAELFAAMSVVAESTSPTSTNSTADHEIVSGLTTPMTTESLADHMTGLGSASPATTESSFIHSFIHIRLSVNHEIGLKATSTNVTTKSPLDEGEGGTAAQHHSTVATVGSSVNLSCATDTEHWDYYPYDRSRVITIYNGGQYR